jgi:Cu/Ag efflux pump CusA
MLRWAVETSVKFRLLVAALAAGLLALGVIQLQNARVDALPEFDPPYIEIQTEALGLSAAEVEQLITVPLEADLLNGVAFLDSIRSDSVPGLSSVVMIFEPGTDLYRARQLVAERMTQAHALPNVSKPPVMLEPVSSSSRAMVLGMSSARLSLIEQSVLARWTIRPRLLGVPGVSNVAVFGQRERQLQVQVDPARLASRGVGLSDVLATTGNAMWVSPLTFLQASTPGTGGFIDTPNQRLSVQNISPVVDAATLSQVAVEGHPGLRLGDVAAVVEDHQPLIGDGITDGGSGLTIVVEKYPEASTVDVTRGVEAALRDLAPGLADLQIDSTVYRPAGFVEAATANLGRTLLIGLALATLLTAALFSWRAAVTGLVTVALSTATAVVVLAAFGVPMNLLVVLGLIGGLVVVIAQTGSGPDPQGHRARVGRAGHGNGGPAEGGVPQVLTRCRTAVYTLVVVALAVSPAFFVPGAAGAFVAPVAVAHLVALTSGLLVAALLLPALAALLPDRTRSGGHPGPAARWLDRRYARRGPRAVPRARTGLVVLLGLLLVGGVTLPVLATSLMPSLRERDLLITFSGPAGAARPEMSRVTTAAATELRTLPGVARVGAHVGRAVQSDRVGDVDAAEIWVTMTPDADHDATVAAVQEVVDGYPGLRREVRTYLDERTGSVLAGTDSELLVRVYGEDGSVLDAKAGEVAQMLAGVAGVQDPVVQRVPLRPTLQVEVDLARAQQFNVKPGDVRRTVAALLAGIEVGSLFEDQKVFEVVVWGTPDLRGSVTAVQDLLVERPDDAGLVRVGDVAEVRVAPAPAVVQRDSSSRYVDVTAAIDGRGYGAVSTEVRQKLAAIPFPFEHRAELVDDYATGQAALARVVAVAAVALALVFFVLQAASQSWRLALLCLALLPAALSGGAVAALLGGRVVSLGTVVGLLAVGAVAIHRMLAQIAAYQQSVTAADPADAVRRTTRSALIPVTAGGFAVALVLLPVLVTGPEAGLELLHPMAVTVVGGLVTTAVVSLIVLPALYPHRRSSRPADDAPAEPANRTELIGSPAS